MKPITRIMPMPISYSEAIKAAVPFITLSNAKVYATQTDGMLWVEENIMDPADIPFTICSKIGVLICETIELRLDALLEFEGSTS
jgi:hypothetical protein